MEYTIERVKLGDEEVLAYIQTESWKAGFKDILDDDILQKCTQIDKATSMYRRLLEQNIGLNRVQADVFDGNIASEHVLTKCGMQFEGIARQKYYKNGKFIDTAQYAILRSDFI